MELISQKSILYHNFDLFSTEIENAHEMFENHDEANHK